MLGIVCDKPPDTLCEGYFPIALDTLCPAPALSFDLYIRPNGARGVVLYRERNYPLAPEDLARLSQRGLQTLYIASDAQKAERLNHARQLLRQFNHLPDAVEQMARDFAISPRQAYRYLQQAQQLKRPLAVADAKTAFTVKLPRSLVARVRSHAATTGLSLSEVVSRALLALLNRRRGRG